MNFKSKEVKTALIYIGLSFIAIMLIMNQSAILNIIKLMFSVFTPFIFGLAIAFIFNAPMRNIEKRVFGLIPLTKKLPASLRRILSYLVTLILITTVLGAFIISVVPALTATIIDFINAVPEAIADFETWISNQVSLETEVGLWLTSINFDFEVVKQNIIVFAQSSVQSWLDSSFNIVSGVFSAFITLSIAFVFSIYVLMSKERLGAQIKLILNAYFSKDQVADVMKVAHQADEIYSSFVLGQVVEAGIIGVIFFVVLSLFNFPYTILISTIIAFTALIPIVGSLLAMVIGIILIATVNPIQSFWFFVIFQTIQNLENNFIYPHVVGKNVGLPAIWVLVAITIGGSLYGVLGIILSIPTFSLFYVLFREQVNARIQRIENSPNSK
ncbi:MAG: phosphoribosylaminoimidazole-succinocarboxamide synthase [Erysipelotrichaceae bacterium]|nr:MAG: phosphoribosylaminoimidazole-succinocarboxamide [Erysipelotrichaceae bacterium]TXT18393.1 MAG: phosphoribosylaminoimidazole-succinocarboxamide synthase [Erysipelotrichaceae bacterium]